MDLSRKGNEKDPATLYNCTEEIEAIHKGDPDELISIWKRKGITFPIKTFRSVFDFNEYVKSINICNLLGLDRNCNCIFHDDHTNSANIFRSKQSGDYLYCCHSSNCDLNAGKNFSGNIITLIRKISVRSDLEILNLLNSEIVEAISPEAQKIDAVTISNVMENNQAMIEQSGKILCPAAMKIVGKDIRILFILYHLVKGKNLTHWNSTKHDVLFSESAEHLRETMHQIFHVANDIKVSQQLAILAYLGFLEKVPYDQISTDRLRSMLRLSWNSNCSDRLINQFRLPEITKDKLLEIEQRAIRWKANHYTKRAFNFQEINKREGIFAAMEIYPQGCRIEQTTNPKKCGRRDRILQSNNTFQPERTCLSPLRAFKTEI